METDLVDEIQGEPPVDPTSPLSPVRPELQAAPDPRNLLAEKLHPGGWAYILLTLLPCRTRGLLFLFDS